MPLRIGETFASYRILRVLGSGGMGEVYLAQHPRLPRQDALKVLRSDISGDTGFRERFIREADLAATLSHPNIVGILDRGEYEGQLWIAMNYVDGIDAGHLLSERYPAGMPVEEVSAIATAVARALDYAHKRGLLHRDVKPANIMLADFDDKNERRILLTDFGIARPIDDPNGLTATNVTVGTVAYAAPEQLMGDDIDGRADQYALAASTYHLLTGAQLFPSSNAAVVIGRHLNSCPPALASTRQDLAPLDAAIAQALAKVPTDRFARCIDFAHAFSGQAKSRAVSSTATTAAAISPGARPQVGQVDQTGTVRANKHGGLKNLWFISAAVLAIVVIGVLATLKWGTDNRTRGATSTPPSTSAIAATLPEPSYQERASAESALTTEPETPSSEGSYSAPLAPRVMDGTRAFSFVVPRGWVQASSYALEFGSAKLIPATPPGAASYTEVILGILDDRLFANAEPEARDAAIRLGSDMGEYVMPYPGVRTNQGVVTLRAGKLSGAANYYDVKFEDKTLENGQIWTGVIGTGTERYFIVWTGTSTFPVEFDAAKALAESIRKA